MGIWIDVARVSTALNVVLLLGLSYVWLDNYRQFHSKHTLGLSVFAILLLCQNALAVYIYSWDKTLSIWFATAVPGPRVASDARAPLLEFVALVFLTWVTWD